VNLIIRDAVEVDLPAIIQIYNATVPTRMVTAELEPTTAEARLPWFREHSPEQYPLWVAETDGRVIGWLDFKRFLPRCAYRGTAEISVLRRREFSASRRGPAIIATRDHPRTIVGNHSASRPNLRAQRAEFEII